VNKVRPWRVVDLAILITHNSTPVPAVVSPLPPEAQETAQEAATYLEVQVDRSAVAAALCRAWEQALALAAHDLKARTGAEPVAE
jgi:hypothetical protein